MGRIFTKNTSNYLKLGVNGINALVSGASAITFAAWVKFTSIGTGANENRIACALVNGASNSGLVMATSASPSKLRFGVRSLSSDGFQTADGTTTLTTGVWYHVAATVVFTSGSRFIQPYLNGVAEGGITPTFGSSTYAPSGVTGEDMIGAGANGSVPFNTALQVDGSISRFAVWTTKLTAGEIASLYGGTPPSGVQSGSLVIDMPLTGTGSTESNSAGASPTGTIVGTVNQDGVDPYAVVSAASVDAWGWSEIQSGLATVPASDSWAWADAPALAATVRASDGWGWVDKSADPVAGGSTVVIMAVDTWGWDDGRRAFALQDTFAGTNGDNLTTYNPTWAYHASYSGSSWLISSGRIRNGQSGTSVALYGGDQATADYDVSASIFDAGGVNGRSGVVGRFDPSSDTGYIAYWDSQDEFITVYKKVAGTATTLGTSGFLSTPTTMTLRMKGTTISVYRNGVQVGSWTDSSISGPGRAGVFGNFSSNSTTNIHLDDFSVSGGSQGPEYIATFGADQWGWADASPVPRVTILLADAWGWTESGTLAATVRATDPWSFADRQAVAATIAATDQWGWADAAVQDVTTVTIIQATDSWGWSDAGRVSVAIQGADSWGWSDAGALSAVTRGADAWGWAERHGLAAAVLAADSWGWADAGSLVATLRAGDQWGWAEVASLIVQRYSTDQWGWSDASLLSVVTVTIEYRIYANDGLGGAIDYATPIASTTGLTWTSGVLAFPGMWRFGVRVHDIGTDLEELNLDAAVDLILDGAGADITNRPAAPTGLTATPIAGGEVRLDWNHNIGTGGTPQGFRVYRGVGSVDYGTAVATVPYAGAAGHRVTISGLTDGVTYRFGVRAWNATAEEMNTAYAVATADATGPGAVDGLSGVGVGTAGEL